MVSALGQSHPVDKLSLKNKELSGMGTTLVGCVICKHKVVLFNIGDSCIYHVRGERVRKLTRDHSLVQTLIDSGQISPEEAAHHPNKNIITRVVGVDEHVKADISRINLSSGYLLLCSDGLYDELTCAEIERVMRENPGNPAFELVKAALKNGGGDNVTCVVVNKK